MKVYSKTTKELFGCISLISPFSIFRFKKLDIKVVRMKSYCYLFPQKSSVWNSDKVRNGVSIMYKHQSLYWFLVWQIIITHSRTANMNIIPKK